jgi:protoheme IX farnesyltransferase
LTTKLFSHGDKPAAQRSKVGSYIALTKPRIVELLLVTTIPTMVLAQRGWPSIWLMVWTFVGGSLAAAGANAINMYIDRDIDKLMERTRHRPLVTGAIQPRNALVFAITLEVVAFAILVLGANLLAACLAMSATAFYVFVYSLWLKRSSKQNIVIGGLSGAMPPALGWAAVADSVPAEAWLLVLIIFIWTPPHFWALALYRTHDYANAGLPMLPVTHGQQFTRLHILLYSVALVATTVLPYIVAMSGWLYLLSALLLGALFVWYAWKLYRVYSDELARKLFRFSILYLSLLFAALLVDHWLIVVGG